MNKILSDKTIDGWEKKLLNDSLFNSVDIWGDNEPEAKTPKLKQIYNILMHKISRITGLRIVHKDRIEDE